MGYSSQSGQVGFKTQAARGVYADPGAAPPDAGLFAKLRSGGLGTNRDLLVADPEIGGGRDTVDAYLGAASWSGDFDFYGRFDFMALMLASAFGDAAVAGDAGVGFTHTLTPLDAATLPFLSIEERIGSGLETYNYTDAVVNTFHLEADANGYLQGTAGIIAAKQTAGNVATAAGDWDGTPMVVGTNIAVTYNGIALPAKSFSLDFSNNFEDDDFRLGSFFLGDLTAKARELTFGVTYRPVDAVLWRQAVYGSAGATTVSSGVAAKHPLVITLTSYEAIPGAGGAFYTMTISADDVVIEPYSFEPSGDDVIQSDLTLRAVRPDPGTPLCTATVLTDMATLP